MANQPLHREEDGAALGTVALGLRDGTMTKAASLRPVPTGWTECIWAQDGLPSIGQAPPTPYSPGDTWAMSGCCWHLSGNQGC